MLPRWFASRRLVVARRRLSSGGGGDPLRILSAHKGHARNNVPETVAAKVDRKLHLLPNHPLGIIKAEIEKYCAEYASRRGQVAFRVFDDESPVVRPKQNFDTLLIPPDHVSRRPSDTYYISDDLLLRTHTSAHQNELIAQGVPAFLCTGDVYRRDEIDSSHYPVFHQMEGVRIFPASGPQAKAQVEADLKALLTGLALHLFGPETQTRWRDDYFPFTQPSFELDVFFEGDWLEVLGCGVVHDEVMQMAGKSTDTHAGWAFGLGLERLAMVLFRIPDIRLFWSEDERFHSQFSAGATPDGWRKIKFSPYSKFPLCYKDVSFWLPQGGLHPNDVYEVIRGEAGDLVEQVRLFDQFHNKKTRRDSHAYRVSYRHMDRSLTNEEVDEVQWRVRDRLVAALGVALR